MTEGEAAKVLQRKVDAGRPRSDPNGMSALKAAGIALTKVADAQMTLPLQVTEAAEVAVGLSDLPDLVEDGALLMMLAGPAGASGLVALSPILLAALIERRTTGRIGTGEVPQRRPTRTDAAIAAGFVDPVLAALAETLGGLPEADWVAGYRFAAAADDMRSVLLKLEDTAFRALRLMVKVTEGGSRTGGLLLVLPRQPAMARPAAGETGPGAASEGATMASVAEARDWSARIEAAVMEVPAQVTGVLWRATMSLSDVLSLVPGSCIPLPREALERIPLEGTDGRILAHGRLGQSRGHRAIRIRIGEDETAPSAIPGPETGAAYPPDRDDGRTARRTGGGPSGPSSRPDATPPDIEAFAVAPPMEMPLAGDDGGPIAMPMAMDLAFSPG